MIQRYKAIAFASLALLLAAAGCIKNDIPYPRIVQSIMTLVPEGQTLPSAIDEETLSAVVYLDEKVDIRKVKFSDFTYTEGASVSVDLLSGEYDLSRPMTVVLSKYQEYVWTISAVQEIERYLTVKGQVGKAVIDVPGRRVLVRVSDRENLTNLTLKTIKLGPEGLTTMVPDLKPGRINLLNPLDVDITAFGRTERWTIYAEKTDFVVYTSAVDAWSQVVWAYGESQEDVPQGFQYKKTSDAKWIDVPASAIVSEGTSFHACIPHLEPLTEYEVRAVSGEELGDAITVTTQDTRVLPDGSFDDWWLDGKKWCPWAIDGQRFWDTGNAGAVMAGSSNTTPSDYTSSGVGKSARLETIFANLFGMGKLASGSVFSGIYVATEGTNGILNFGREWNLRPTRLRGYFQYSAKKIDLSATEELNYLKGRPDSCHIYIALTDWTAPFEVRTKPSARQLFNPSDPSVIAYGELIYSGEMNSYKEFVIDLKYNSTSRIPSYIQITTSSSKYGDYFVGGVGSLLYIDEFSLDYDY